MSFVGALDTPSPLRLERLRDGALIAVRVDEPPTDSQLHELLTEAVALAPGLMRRRALTGIITRQPLPAALTAPDADRILAVEASSGAPVGAVACRPLDDQTAVGWIEVRRGWRHRGVGTALLDVLAERARRDGCRRIQGRFRVTDDRMLRLVQRLGGRYRTSRFGDAVELDVPIGPAGDGPGVALGAMLWCVARGGLMPVLTPPRRPYA
jgi:GNAT superfamily N-acetyltransferase